MKMFQRKIHFDCANHNLSKVAYARSPERKLLSAKYNGVFSLKSALEGWKWEMEHDFGCTDFETTLDNITEVEVEDAK